MRMLSVDCIHAMTDEGYIRNGYCRFCAPCFLRVSTAPLYFEGTRGARCETTRVMSDGEWRCVETDMHPHPCALFMLGTAGRTNFPKMPPNEVK